MSPLNAAVIGAGMALQMLHWPSIASQSDLYRLHSVLDRSGRGRVQETVSGEVKVVNSLDGILQDPQVDLVVVASPNTSHFEYVSAALNAGKHVLVEKPITPNEREARQLIDLAKSKGLILSVYQNRRWDSDFLTVKKLLEQGMLGDIVEFQSSYDRYRPLPPQNVSWKETPGQGNDVIYNLGSHIIDQAYTLFGMPEKLYCRSWDMRGTGLEEAFVLDLSYPPPRDGAAPLVVTLRASIVSALPKQLRFLIKGTKGTFIKYGVDPQGNYIKSLVENRSKGPDYGREPEEDWGEMLLADEPREDTPFSTSRIPSEPGDWPQLYTNLHAAITQKDRGVLVTKPEQAADVIRLIELGLRSSKEGRTLRVAPNSD